MKANQIEVGRKYMAKVSGNLTTVRVDAIREVSRSRMNYFSGRLDYTDKVVYDVTNLTTGRQTMFRSAAKFRGPATDTCERTTTMKIEITTHQDTRHVCTIEIDGQYSERQIAAIANEAGGLAELAAMGESDLPAGYEWTGDEEYEVIA